MPARCGFGGPAIPPHSTGGQNIAADPGEKWNPAGDELCSEPSRVPRPAARCHRRCFAASLWEDAAGSAGPPHVASPRWEPWSQPQGHAHGVGAPRRDSGGGGPRPSSSGGARWVSHCCCGSPGTRGQEAPNGAGDRVGPGSCPPPAWGLKKKEAQLGRCLLKEEERRVRNGSKAMTLGHC